jgi:hypothetical protein
MIRIRTSKAQECSIILQIDLGFGDSECRADRPRCQCLLLECLDSSLSGRPWTRKISRAIQEERKIYLWDIPRIKDPAARFENMTKISETQPSPALLKFQALPAIVYPSESSFPSPPLE